MKYIINMLFLILLSTNVYTQNKFPLVIDHYNLELSFDYKEELMNGICELKILNLSDETVNQIPLLLYRLLSVESVQNKDSERLTFTQNVTQFEDFQKLQANHIRIALGCYPLFAGRGRGFQVLFGTELGVKNPCKT